MAKKKTKKSVPLEKNKSVSSSKPAQQHFLSSDQIGEVAGEIWQLLAEQSGQSLASIKKSLNAPADVVVAAVGWLAREGKLEFRKSGRTVKVSLR